MSRCRFGSSWAIHSASSAPSSPGHDAEVVGEEPCVMIDVGEEDADYAKGEVSLPGRSNRFGEAHATCHDHGQADSSASPERVLAAAYDFSERREEIWPNVKTKHLHVHAQGETYAEVTEATWVVGLFWERCRYDWSRPGIVTATVLDSNLKLPRADAFVFRPPPVTAAAT